MKRPANEALPRTAPAWTRALALACLLGAPLLGAGCKGSGDAGAQSARPAAGGAGSRKPSKFPVEVQTVTARQVEYSVTAVGSVDAFEIVQVTARIPGAVERVRFSEGEKVAPAAVLVEIEPQRYRLAVEAAKATLGKAQVTLEGARTSLDRREKAVAGAPGLIPGDELATFRTRLATAQAEVAEARTALAQAELNLREAYVRAPVGGLIETRRVATGQYVQPGTVLATLVRREPLLLRFSVPAPEAAQLRPGELARFQVREDNAQYEARIRSVAQAADTASRMVAVVAEVTSAERAVLRPGAFAEVVIPIGGRREAPVIPQTAVRPTERGFVGFVVEGDVAKERLLTLGLRTSDGLIELRGGISAGEKVVVRGAEALREGASVLVEGAKPAGGGGKPPEARSMHP